jgi:hypothetical protein
MLTKEVMVTRYYYIYTVYLCTEMYPARTNIALPSLCRTAFRLSAVRTGIRVSDD